MKFGNPHFLWLLCLVPALIFFYVWAFKKKKKLLELFLDPVIKDRLLTGVSFKRQKIKAALLIMAVFLAILSLIRPKWGFHWEEVKAKGVDIIVALDVSKSMLAQDVSPNRLKRAKREIIDLLHIVQGDRIGLVAFAGVSFLQSPLTLDYGAVQIFLDDLDTDLIPIPGTAIGDAIRLAIKSFEKEDKNSRVLILITDGEDHQGNPLEAAKLAKQEGIKIYTVGIGKEGGAPIPNEEGGGFKKDHRGQVIMTQLDEETLKKIALETGGNYVRSVSGDMDLEKIYEDVRRTVEEKELKSGRRQRFEERFQWPLFLAILLILLEVFVQERTTKNSMNGLKSFLKNWAQRKMSLFFMILASISFLISPIISSANPLFNKTSEAEKAYKDGKYKQALEKFLEAQIENPNDETLKYNLANTYYKLKQYEEAHKLYESLSTQGNQEMAAKANFNLGNTAYRQGKLEESVKYYEKALELNPQDIEAQKNLKFVRDEVKRRLEENKKRMEQQQQNQQQKQSQQEQNSSNNSPKDQDGTSQESSQEESNSNKKDGNSKEEEKEKELQDDGEQEQEKNQGQKAGQGQERNQDTSQEHGKHEDMRKEEEKQAKMGQQENSSSDQDPHGPQDPKEKDENNASYANAQNSKETHQNHEGQSNQEVIRWLDTLEEDRKKILRNRMPESKRYRVDKDW